MARRVLSLPSPPLPTHLLGRYVPEHRGPGDLGVRPVGGERDDGEVLLLLLLLQAGEVGEGGGVAAAGVVGVG